MSISNNESESSAGWREQSQPLCFGFLHLFFSQPFPPLLSACSPESSVSSSMVLCMETQNSDYAALPSSPRPFFFFFFFFFTLWQMSPDGDPDVTQGQMSLPAVLHSAGSLLELRGNRGGLVGEEVLVAAWGIRCARTEKEEKGPDEWDQRQRVDVTEWTAKRAPARSGSMCACVSRSDWGTAAGGEMDASQSCGIRCVERRWCHWILVDACWVLCGSMSEGKRT